MKYFVISDLHGYLIETITALTKKGWDIKNKNHKLIVAGDILDGNKEEQVSLIQWLINLKSCGKAIVIKGNHDYHFEINKEKNLINPSHKYDQEWLQRFSKQTKNWIKTLPSSYQTKTHIITHGMWFPQLNKGGTLKHKIYGSPNMITCKQNCWNDISYMKTFKMDVPWKTIDEYTKDLPKKTVVGHFWTPNFRYGHHCGLRADSNVMKKFNKEDWNIWKSKDGKLIAIDGGVYFKNGKINVYTFEE